MRVKSKLIKYIGTKYYLIFARARKHPSRNNVQIRYDPLKGAMRTKWIGCFLLFPPKHSP